MHASIAQLFRTVASELGYKKTDRVIASVADYDHAIGIISRAKLGAHALIFNSPTDFFEVSEYGHSITLAGVGQNRPNQNHVTRWPELSEAFLRNLFTGTELLAFKACHIIFENQRYDYNWETEKTRIRVKKLLKHIDPSSAADRIADFEEIFYTRDAFAHTFVEIKNIKYKNTPLEYCFSKDSVHSTDFNFIDDVDVFLKPIFGIFIERQWEQFDKNRFCALCDAEVRTRSLGPQ
jgi:hypothetical protein